MLTWVLKSEWNRSTDHYLVVAIIQSGSLQQLFWLFFIFSPAIKIHRKDRYVHYEKCAWLGSSIQIDLLLSRKPNIVLIHQVYLVHISKEPIALQNRQMMGTDV